MPESHDLATSNRQGLLRKLSGTITNVLRGDGTFGALRGTSTNDNASAGDVGEYVSSTVALADKVSLTTDTAANITSISLTAGDWDVSAIGIVNGAAGTLLQYMIAGISSVSATMPAAAEQGTISYGTSGQAVFASNDVSTALPVNRYSISGTTTVYLVAKAGFTTSTCGAYGRISARRVR